MKAWVVYRVFGFDRVVISRHKTEVAARDRAEKLSPDRGCMAPKSHGFALIGDGASVEVIEVFGRKILRPVVKS